jgi:hypothetical protein
MTNVNEMMTWENNNNSMKVEVSVHPSIERKVKEMLHPKTELVSLLSDAIMYGKADMLQDEHRHMLVDVEVIDIESKISLYEQIVDLATEKLASIEKKGLKASKVVESYYWMVSKGYIDPNNNYDDSYEYFVNDRDSLRKEYKETKKGLLYNQSMLDIAKEQYLNLFCGETTKEEDVICHLPKSNAIHWEMVEYFGESFLIKLRNGVHSLDDTSIWKVMGETQQKRDRKELTFKHFVEAMGILYKQAYGITSDVYYSHRLDAMRKLWTDKIVTKTTTVSGDVYICKDKAWYDSKGKETTDPNKVSFGWSDIELVPAECKWDAIQNISYDAFIGRVGKKITA